MAKTNAPESINLRCSTDDKELAELCSKADGRSLTNYVIMLIRADAAKRGIKAKGKR